MPLRFTHSSHFALLGYLKIHAATRAATVDISRRESCRLKTCCNTCCVPCQKCVSNLQEEMGVELPLTESSGHSHGRVLGPDLRFSLGRKTVTKRRLFCFLTFLDKYGWMGKQGGNQRNPVWFVEATATSPQPDAHCCPGCSLNTLPAAFGRLQAHPARHSAL